MEVGAPFNRVAKAVHANTHAVTHFVTVITLPFSLRSLRLIATKMIASSGLLAFDRADHHGMDRAVIRARRFKKHRRAERAWVEVAGVD